MDSQDKKIMVIDDDNNNTNNLIKFFLQKEGYNVDSFIDSIEALDSFEKDKYDLVLLDSKIPNLKEDSLYQKFKEVDNKVSICFTNADIESVEEIKKQAPEMDNNKIISESISLDDQTKLDILLLENNDTILIKS
jgi:two-component system phosphate regulon response regulator PhoB/two-component system alkaline phosphatase synthesis response regulator PhoP